MLIGELEQKTSITVKKMNGFESYINAIVFDTISEDVTFTGYV